MIIEEITGITEARRGKKRKPDQVKAGEKKPKKVKPTTGGESPHPYQGRLVGGN